MRVYCCRPNKCDKKDTCNHYIIKSLFGELVTEDLSDICDNGRLYIEGDYYKGFPNKDYYKDLLDFYDSKCEGGNCNCKEIYEDSGSSKVDCKLGDKFTCEHKLHPENKFVFDTFAFFKAVNETFKKEGITNGTVHFPCPICNGEAHATRYRGRNAGGGCSLCHITYL